MFYYKVYEEMEYMGEIGFFVRLELFNKSLVFFILFSLWLFIYFLFFFIFLEDKHGFLGEILHHVWLN